MISHELTHDPSPQAWDEFVGAQKGHLLQSSAWGAFKSSFGWSSFRLALERDGTLVAGAQILFRKLAPGLVLAYVPRGPVCDPLDPALFQSLLESIITEVRRRGAFLLKIEPNWELSESGRGASDRLFRSCGYEPAHAFQPRTTVHVDLTRDPDDILAGMKSKWRYNIRLAERKEITVRIGTSADIPTFYRLLETTAQRDRFAIHSLDYYHLLFNLLSPRDEVRLFIAEYQNEPLAAIFVTAFAAESIYLYGASGNAHRERMPNHALHWQAIQWAKARGCARYDLWGIPDTEAVDRAGLPDGLYQFKQGFGGQVVRYVGGYDRVMSRARYALYRKAIQARGRNWT